MTLQSSGVAISLSDIQTEFGGSNPISLSEYYTGGSYVTAGNAAIPASGQISMSNFYGASAIWYPTVTISSNVSNFNLATYLGSIKGSSISSLGIPIICTVVINSGVLIDSTSPSNAAFDTGTGWPSGSSITITNNGRIHGKGGAGANGNNNTDPATFAPSGGDGGTAFAMSYNVTFNNYGYILAGGGGGGAGGAAQWTGSAYCGGGGGGSGASAGGITASSYFPGETEISTIEGPDFAAITGGVDGTNSTGVYGSTPGTGGIGKAFGTYYSYGNGGEHTPSDYYSYYCYGGRGGSGGQWGMAGEQGWYQDYNYPNDSYDYSGHVDYASSVGIEVGKSPQASKPGLGGRGGYAIQRNSGTLTKGGNWDTDKVRGMIYPFTEVARFTGDGTYGGSFTWVVPSGIYQIYCDLVSGGGGGAGGFGWSGWAGNRTGVAGPAGGYGLNYPLSVTPGETLTIKVGSGGAGGPGKYENLGDTSGGAGEESYVQSSAGRTATVLAGQGAGTGWYYSGGSWQGAATPRTTNKWRGRGLAYGGTYNGIGTRADGNGGRNDNPYSDSYGRGGAAGYIWAGAGGWGWDGLVVIKAAS